MKNIIRVKNNKVKLNIKKHNLNLEEYGFLYYLKELDSECQIEELFVSLNITMNKFKEILNRLANEKVLTIDINPNGYSTIEWEILFIEESKEKCLNKEEHILNYEKLFILNEVQKEQVSNVLDKKELFLRLYRIYESTKEKYLLKDTIVIDNEEHYKLYLRRSSPITILLNNQIEPTLKDVNLLFEVIYTRQVEVEVMNFLIEYVIYSSVYKNFSINYFITVLNNWEKNNIETLEDAMEYINTAKDKVENMNSAYKEPVWDEGLEKVMEEDLIEVERLLNKTD